MRNSEVQFCEKMSRKTIFVAFTLKNSSVAEFFVRLSNDLNRSYKVIIFTHAVEKNTLEIEEGIEIVKWPSPRPTRMADMIFLIKMIKKFRPAILISNFAAVNVFLIAGYLCKVPQRIAWYHTLYDQLEKNAFLKMRKQLVYRLATKMVANSEASRKDLIKNFGLAESKILVVHNALKPSEWKNTGTPEKIVYAGRLDTVKGVKTLIQAMPLVTKEFSELKLHIIGDDRTGGEAESLKALVRELQLENHVIFRGNMSRNSVLKEFSTAWFSVVPSQVEAFGYVVIESFSVGTPVIGSDTTGIAEIIQDNMNGLLFKVGNFRDLAGKMRVLLKDHELRHTFSLNCKKSFEKKYELSASVEQLRKKLFLA